MPADVISIQICMINDELGILSQRYLEKTNEFLAFVRNRIEEVNETFIFMQASSKKKRIFRTYKQALRKFSVNQIKFQVETFNVFYFLLRLLYAISSLLIAASKKVVGAKNPAINIWSYCWANVKAAQGRRKQNWQRQA